MSDKMKKILHWVAFAVGLALGVIAAVLKQPGLEIPAGLALWLSKAEVVLTDVLGFLKSFAGPTSVLLVLFGVALALSACGSALRDTWTGYTAARSGWNAWQAKYQADLASAAPSKGEAHAALADFREKRQPVEDALDAAADVLLAATFGKASPGAAAAAVFSAIQLIVKIKAELAPKPTSQPSSANDVAIPPVPWRPERQWPRLARRHALTITQVFRNVAAGRTSPAAGARLLSSARGVA
jgi:hypothetical protein